MYSDVAQLGQMGGSVPRRYVSGAVVCSLSVIGAVGCSLYSHLGSVPIRMLSMCLKEDFVILIVDLSIAVFWFVRFLLLHGAAYYTTWYWTRWFFLSSSAWVGSGCHVPDDGVRLDGPTKLSRKDKNSNNIDNKNRCIAFYRQRKIFAMHLAVCKVKCKDREIIYI